MVLLPNDVIRLILMKSSLDVIKVFLIYYPNPVTDVFWHVYLYGRVPEEYHSILYDAYIDTKYMRDEGTVIIKNLRMIAHDEDPFRRCAWFLESGSSIVKTFKMWSFVFSDQDPWICQCREENMDKDINEIRVTIDANGNVAVKRSITIGIQREQCEKKTYPLERFYPIVRNILFTGGSRLVQTPLNKIVSIFTTSSNE